MQKSCSMPLPVPCYGKYHVYSSTPTLSHADRQRKPKPVQQKSGTCFPNHAANIRTRGAHEFYNMMWDPSVYRGITTKAFTKSEMDRCNMKKELDASIKRRKFPRKQRLVGGIVRTSLDLAAKEEKPGLGDMGMQTDKFLQELTIGVVKKEMCTQVEADANARKGELDYNVFKPFMIGNSQECQTDPCLTFNFQDSVRPIQKQLSYKIMEQSLLETTEEMELEALRKEKRKYIEMRCEEMYRWKRAADAQRIVAENRIRAMDNRAMEARMEREAEARLAAALYSAGCMGGLLPITFGLMRLEGYLPGSGSLDIYENILPWMDEAVRKSYDGRQLSRKLLDDMLNNVTIKREAEIASSEFMPLPPPVRSSQSQFSPTEGSDMSLPNVANYQGSSMMFQMNDGDDFYQNY